MRFDNVDDDEDSDGDNDDDDDDGDRHESVVHQAANTEVTPAPLDEITSSLSQNTTQN